VGRAGGLALWIFVVIVQCFTGATCQLACIRSLYAISRDHALPDMGLLARVNKKTLTPLWAAWAVVFVSSLFGLLQLISYVAINAVFSITAVALDLSYAIPVFMKLVYKNHPEYAFRPGPFYLGRWSVPINVFALVWTIFECAILIMPQEYPVNSQTMNYAAPIIVGVIVFSVVFYFSGGRRMYKGPGHHD